MNEAAAPVTTQEQEAGSPPSAELRDWLDQMLVIRQFEAESVRLSLSGQIPGGIHSSAGQEGVAVGVAKALGPDDVVSGTHRSHHHALAKGLTPREVMAELFGKADGCAGGRGGSMHLVGFGRHFLGSNGIVGAGLGLAMGASLAMKMRAQQSVAVGYFGDGGANTGRVWEFINLAALWKLPLIAYARTTCTRSRPTSRTRWRASRWPPGPAGSACLPRASTARTCWPSTTRSAGPGPGAGRPGTDLHRGADLPVRGS